MSVTANGDQIHISAWDRGVSMFGLWPHDVRAARDVLVMWLDDKCGIARIRQRFPNATISAAAVPHESGALTEVRAAWRRLQTGWSPDFPHLHRLIQSAELRPELRDLFPYTSLTSLQFSRCTGYPYTRKDPYVWTALWDGIEPLFRVGGGWQEEGQPAGFSTNDVQEALDELVARLPDGAPVRQGTAEDGEPSDDSIDRDDPGI